MLVLPVARDANPKIYLNAIGLMTQIMMIMRYKCSAQKSLWTTTVIHHALHAHWSPSFYFRFPLIMGKSLLCFTIHLISSKKTSKNEKKKKHFFALICGRFSSRHEWRTPSTMTIFSFFHSSFVSLLLFSFFAKHFHRASTGVSSWVLNVLRVHCHFTRTRHTHTHTRAHARSLTRAQTRIQWTYTCSFDSLCIRDRYTRWVLYAQFIFVCSVGRLLHFAESRLLWGVAKVFYSKIDGGTIHQQNNQMRVFIIEWVCFTNMCFVIFC